MGTGRVALMAAETRCASSSKHRTDALTYSDNRSYTTIEIDTYTRAQIHRGSFADGQATPDRYSEDRQIGGFAEGEADPAGYRDEDRVGTFAGGSARPAAYPTDRYEGTFAQEARPVD